jgi:hypothetical protein
MWLVLGILAGGGERVDGVGRIGEVMREGLEGVLDGFGFLWEEEGLGAWFEDADISRSNSSTSGMDSRSITSSSSEERTMLS